jgi:hypothetical protein
MNRLCYEYLNHAGVMDDDMEESLIDHLELLGYETTIDMTREDICNAILLIEPYKPKKYNKINTELTSELPNTGYIDVDLYMKIAMDADRDTLNSMSRASSYHSKKFDDEFYKEYLLKHYPVAINFKPAGMLYKDYYLKLVYSIYKLYEDYNFPYFPSPELNPIIIYKQVKTLKSLPRWHTTKYLLGEGVITAAAINDRELVLHFIGQAETQNVINDNLLGERSIRRAMNLTNDPEIRRILEQYLNEH